MAPAPNEFPDVRLQHHASHRYDLSRATFQALFPRIRPGGIYVLEDYGWAHTAGFQSGEHGWFQRPALTNLVFEVTMMLASRPGLVARVDVLPGLCLIYRGPRECPRPFDIDDHIVARGRKLTPI